MSVKQGCHFCIRYGLPILPVRPALMEQSDILPPLSPEITVSVPAKGETTYTARLLREGFLNIWSELRSCWINYYVTSDGYYYPLRDTNFPPLDIVDGRRKPCITEPGELATASLVTLPVRPLGMKNGVFWFGWSEVEWTDTIRKQHEDPEYRSRSMQRFDMDAWINSGTEKQALPITQLTSTVAEYSARARGCTHKSWSPAPFVKFHALHGEHLLQAANRLYEGKGAIVVLSDPIATTRELSHLLTWRLKTRFAEDPHYARGIALSSALAGLEQSMTAQFRRELLSEDQTQEQMAQAVGTRVIAGVPLPPDNPEQAAEVAKRNNAATFERRLDQRVKLRWADYEKYIDRDKEKAFLDELGIAVAAYNENVVAPMTTMYLALLNSSELTHYFSHNFDTANVQSGLCYVQSVTDCLEGMQDQVPVSQWLYSKLVAESFSGENYILQALVFNNDQVAELIQEATRKTLDVNELPWVSLIDGIKNATEEHSKAFSLKMEHYLNTISSGVIRLIDRVAGSQTVLAVVAMVAGSGHGLKTMTLKSTRKHFLEATLRQIAEMTDINFRVPTSKLRPYLDQVLHSMEQSGIPMDKAQERRFTVLIGREEARQLAALPKNERIHQANRVLHSSYDITSAAFPLSYRNKIALLKGSNINRIASLTAGALPFWGCMVSVIFQGAALKSAARDKELLSWEKGSRFAANVVGATGTLLELVERALNDLKALRLKAIVRRKLGKEFLKKTMFALKQGVKYCSRAALVAVGWDFFNGVDYMKKGEYGLMAASFISAVGGGIMLSGALFGLVLGPLGIAWAVLFIFSSAIYMALKGDNAIQDWLKSCLWRKAEKGLYRLPEIYPTHTMEAEAFTAAITPKDD
ncbi:hypothetical protein A9B99_20715 [Mangrovibacter phragmitis]|uniref:Toxin VasX N-terminal region domain-containing protein n=1 Tax=Mangrovibacter phragmitis TaxID=1691903 RepID=A0A1B7L5L7_9ENTR|nr:T6SS effector BTH_I2691 family protein [Mangrovibacter phragmitis]OAT77632.1 hypothetical protein A9B99_20715 [Mangrovibacter phragmitis]